MRKSRVRQLKQEFAGEVKHTRSGVRFLKRRYKAQRSGKGYGVNRREWALHAARLVVG